MHVLIVYDIDVSRVNKVHKFLRTYLNWVQNSVFEGEVSKSQLFEIRQRVKKLIHPKTDSVLLYVFGDEKYVKKEVLGVEKADTERVI